ncbi:MAG TPA: hypothetical protein VK325_07665 [Pseudoxanthomonas sp.]|nr:hypothetical protein [Pseudoxanthomonas sp.]
MVILSSTTRRPSSNPIDSAGGFAPAASVLAAGPVAEGRVMPIFPRRLGQTRRARHRTGRMLAGNDSDAFHATVLDCLTALPPVAAEPLPAAAGLSAVIESVSGARP